jgi:tetratricopeptide (TPR) repeat protein
MAKANLHNGQCKKAIEQLQQAQAYPDNLGEGKLFGAQENDIFYWLGMAYAKAGEAENAAAYFKKATEGLSEPTAAMFYNDQPPDKIFYQGLAWKKLGKKEKANLIFNRLIEYGKSHLNDEVKIDYFAVSLPDLLIFEDDLNLRNKIHCLYMMGLGYLGLNDKTAASAAFDQVLADDNMHFGARTHSNMIAKINLVPDLDVA